ncbi:hypothetical protein CALVIDRAFT_599904 [Calocera viscosa TUFC12733]|uniref:Uncharacterized protein n=1 Tax=Calocera viscosa (strain TUFC12733) TaxID=1330018 RepID=A0A167KDD1_CALVF|nr:hypothetical protein CALVIDRAFT_599904 [Calocera viscosa TUFC12733]
MPVQTRSKRSTTRVNRVEGSSQVLAERPPNLSTSRVEHVEGSSQVTDSSNLSQPRIEPVEGSSFDRSCTSINTLPVELVRYIIRLATEVPVAFDTRSESVLDEDRVETRSLIIESIKTKSALSIVSKLFHVLIDEYLYEILLLTKFPGSKTLRLFAAFLKTTQPDGKPHIATASLGDTA